MKKYQDYTKEQLLEVIKEKNNTIMSLNGSVYYYKRLDELHKETIKNQKHRLLLEYLRTCLVSLLANEYREKQSYKIQHLITKIEQYHSVCLECQFVPNGINMDGVDTGLLQPGEKYHHFIKYEF